jgi:hypothetical protein
MYKKDTLPRGFPNISPENFVRALDTGEWACVFLDQGLRNEGGTKGKRYILDLNVLVLSRVTVGIGRKKMEAWERVGLLKFEEILGSEAKILNVECQRRTISIV